MSPRLRRRTPVRVPLAGLLVFMLLFAWTVPQVPTAYSSAGQPVAASHRAVPAVEELLELVAARFAELKDITGIITINSYTNNSPQVLRQSEFEVQAIAPSLLRITFRKPELWLGNIFVLDYEANILYQYSPIYDMVQCDTPEAFLAQFGIDLDLAHLFGGGGTAALESLEVVRVEELNGVDHAVIKGTVPEALEEGVDTVQETIEGAVGKLGVDVTDTVYLWVDLERLVVTKVEEYSADGRLVLSLHTSDVRIDSGLNAAALKSFRGADIHPSCRF
ncbi:MAG: outer membrane lipoprotein-sorting protein [Firmicutes bacterium]|nr:outer membrane lipoprotein-sorting protein [Bacillota bacterium]